jgi:hypothetical protein
MKVLFEEFLLSARTASEESIVEMLERNDGGFWSCERKLSFFIEARLFNPDEKLGFLIPDEKLWFFIEFKPVEKLAFLELPLSMLVRE